MSGALYMKQAISFHNNICNPQDPWLEMHLSIVPFFMMIGTLIPLHSKCRGRKKVLFISVCMLAVGIICASWFPNNAIEIIGRILMGIGAGMIYQVRNITSFMHVIAVSHVCLDILCCYLFVQSWNYLMFTVGIK